MKNKVFLWKILMGLIGIFLFSISTAFASGTRDVISKQEIDNVNLDYSIGLAKEKVDWPQIQWPWSSKEKTEPKILKEKKLERMGSMLSHLVKEGIITQEKSDEILKQYEGFVASKELQRQERKPLFDQLVEDNVLTKKEADAIKEALSEKMEDLKKQGKLDKKDRVKAVKEVLYELIEDEILTHDKLEKTLRHHEERMAEIKRMKKDGGFWDQLVTKGIITEKEAESIKGSCKDFYEKYKKHKKNLEQKKNQ